jgi:hypothetical protein
MKTHPRTRIIFIIMILSLLVTNCSLYQKSNGSTAIEWEHLQIAPKTNDDLCAEILPEEIDTGSEIKQDFTSGIVVGFFPKDLSKPHKIAYDTYWVDSNEELLLDWIFWYPEANEVPVNLRLFLLLDEQQLTGALPNPGGYNDLHLDKGDDVTLQVTIPPLTPGIHDLIAVAVPFSQIDPDAYGRVNLFYRRITLIVEPISSPFREISFVSLPAEGSIRKNDPAMPLELTLKTNGIDIWNWPDPWLPLNVNTPVRFYALAGHEDVTNVDAPSLAELEESFFSLLLFVDYQQVEVAPNQISLYGKVDKDTAYTRIPLEISPLAEGKHHLLVLRIDTPGVPVCILNGGVDPKGRFLPSFVDGRLVGINVLPSKSK